MLAGAAVLLPGRDLRLTDFGGDVNAAVAVCAKAGGGRVVVPAGDWPTGPIVLKSRVELYLEAGATLRFSQDSADYPLTFTRFEGTELMNHAPFIYAFGESDIAITGEGTLDGQADETHWWDWTHKAGDDRKALVALATQGVAVKDRVFGSGHYLRPNFIQPYRCRNVLIEGVRIVRSPMWEIHPVLCRNVSVRGVRIASKGPNNDGCDPESCRDVLIEGCEFDTGDDCIAIKSGRNADGRRIAAPCENIVIRNCRMTGGHGGVSIGSEASGGVRNVLVHDCHMGSPDLARALRIKSNSWRGGFVENVVFRDVSIDQVADDVFQVDLAYEEGAGGPFNPRIDGIVFERVTCGKADRALCIRGYPDDRITGVRVRDCVFDKVATDNLIENADLRVRNVLINGKTWQA